jgi:hypothetical protein
MDIEQAVLENLRSLPFEEQVEVLTFIQSLRQRFSPTSQLTQPTPLIQTAENVLLNLKRIQHFHDRLPSAVYACELLEATQGILARFSNEPLARFLNTLHDFLALENRWGRYTVEFYQLAYSLLTQFVQQQPTEEDVASAIHILEKSSLSMMHSGIVTDGDLDDIDEYLKMRSPS